MLESSDLISLDLAVTSYPLLDLRSKTLGKNGFFQFLCSSKVGHSFIEQRVRLWRVFGLRLKHHIQIVICLLLDHFTVILIYLIESRNGRFSHNVRQIDLILP